MPFPQKLLKTIVTRCAIFSLKLTKNRLAAGLRPDPLLSAPPDPWPQYGGLLLKGGEGKGWEGREGRGGEEGKEVERGSREERRKEKGKERTG